MFQPPRVGGASASRRPPPVWVPRNQQCPTSEKKEEAAAGPGPTHPPSPQEPPPCLVHACAKPRPRTGLRIRNTPSHTGRWPQRSRNRSSCTFLSGGQVPVEGQTRRRREGRVRPGNIFLPT